MVWHRKSRAAQPSPPVSSITHGFKSAYLKAQEHSRPNCASGPLDQSQYNPARKEHPDRPPPWYLQPTVLRSRTNYNGRTPEWRAATKRTACRRSAHCGGERPLPTTTIATGLERRGTKNDQPPYYSQEPRPDHYEGHATTAPAQQQ